MAMRTFAPFLRRFLLCFTLLLCLCAFAVQAEAARYVPESAAIQEMGDRDGSTFLSSGGIFMIFTLTHYDHVLLILEDEHDSLWAELRTHFEAQMTSYTLAHRSLNPVFAFGTEVLSHYAQNRTGPTHYHITVSHILVSATARKYVKLTQTSFQHLREEGVPEAVLEDLRPLEGHEFSQEEDFEQAVEEHLGSEQLAMYQAVIDKHTDRGTFQGRLLETAHDMDSWNTRVNTQVNIESWNALFLYPKKMRDALTYNGEKNTSAQETSAKGGKEDVWFDVLACLKKWGVPAPLTVILVILLIYFTLNFLARKS